MPCHRRTLRGQALIIFALFSVVLLGAMALSVDAGYLMAQRRGAQGAADAAALAAGKALQRSQTSDIAGTGQAYAAANGFANGSTNTVTVNYPPASGTRAGSSTCVQTTIVHSAQRFLVGAIYSGPWSVSATATACTEPEPRPYALIALDPSGSGLTSGGNSGLTINNGGALSDYNVNICGTASWIQADGPLDSVGGITVCPNADVDALTMNGSAPSMTDPLASVAAPSCGGLTVQPDPNITNSDPSPINLSPGNYSSGITINGNDKVINFASGVYCFGGDLKTNGGSHGNVLKGSDVLFYFGTGAKFNVDGGGNDVVLDSGPGGNCTIPACTAKIVIFYQRTNCADLWLVGGNDTDVDGIIYAPCSLVHLGGASGSEITGQVVAGSATMAGGADLTINYKQYVATSIPQVYLVE
jgi:hypothetical protein